ncbi:MAG: hypothetical protein GX644_11245 [Limnobacter sp.]|nr:hypothetical protein [Limnobacter sp.]
MASQSPARRRSLRLIAQSLAALSGGSAFSALAQGTASPSGFGTPASTAQRIGTGLAQIALLVPPSNGVYQRAGEALIEGMRAAQARDDVTAVEVIEVGESGFELHQLCATLRERGFALAIGPLTRNAVTGLATGGPPALPVLALNQADNIALPGNIITFGLSIESEAAQVAAYAFADASSRAVGRRPRAAIVHDGSPASQRSVGAFIDAWHLHGGEFYEPIQTSSGSIAPMRALLRQVEADVYFVSSPLDTAAALREAVADRARIYGTSLLNSGAMGGSGDGAETLRSPELEGIRIIAMPWQVQRDHPAVLAYPRPAAMGVELQKLYALGIDAYRLGVQLLSGQARLEVDGVTGLLRLDLTHDPRVERLPLLAEYRDGVLVAIDPYGGPGR